MPKYLHISVRKKIGGKLIGKYMGSGKIVKKIVSSKILKTVLSSKLVSRIFRVLGFSKIESRPRFLPVDFTGICDDPREALRRSGGMRAMIEVPLHKTIDLDPVFPSRKTNPYYLTACEYIKNPSLKYVDSALKIYYEEFIPKNAAELLDTNSQRLKGLKPKEAAMPWSGVSGPKVKETRDSRAIRHGKKWEVPLDEEDGDYSIGPFSREKGEMEFKRLIDVLESIKNNGYQPISLEKNIRGIIYESGNDWAIEIINGTHRIPVLAALGFTSIPIIIRSEKGIIRDESACVWPGVVNGDFSEDEAQSLYERVFQGQDPAWLSKFIESSDQYRETIERFRKPLA